MLSWLLGLYLYKSAVSYHIVAIIGGVHTVQSQMYVLLAVCSLTAVFAQVCQNSGQEVSEEEVSLVSGLLTHTEKVEIIHENMNFGSIYSLKSLYWKFQNFLLFWPKKLQKSVYSFLQVNGSYDVDNICAKIGLSFSLCLDHLQVIHLRNSLEIYNNLYFKERTHHTTFKNLKYHFSSY